MSPQQLDTMRELDSRISEGLQVRLLWRETDGHLFVSVTDSRTQDDFTIEVREGEQPLEVFRHPYAYSETHKIKQFAPPIGPISA